MAETRPKTTAVDRRVNDLVRAYRTGRLSREDAFGEIVALVHPPITRVLRYVYGVRSEVEQDDLFQEVMMRFVRSERNLDLGRPVFPWLYEIARNVKKDAVLRQLRESARTQTEGLATRDLASRSQSAFREAVNVRDRKAMLEKALSMLSEADRQILWLKYFDEETDQRIADQLRLSVTTAKFYILRAKTRLCRLLRGRKPPPPSPPPPHTI